MSLNRITSYLAQEQSAVSTVGAEPLPVDPEVSKRELDGTQAEAKQTNVPITRDTLEITPEATQAAKKWNEHVRVIHGEQQPLDSVIGGVLAGL